MYMCPYICIITELCIIIIVCYLIMDIHCEAYPIMDTHNWIIDIHNWTSCAVEITHMYSSWIIVWQYRHVFSALQGFFFQTLLTVNVH